MRTFREVNTDIESYVRQNAPYLTKDDMVQETGHSETRIAKALNDLGITAIGQRQKIKNYIIELYQKKSRQWIADRCNLSMTAIRAYYKELGIKEPEELRKPIGRPVHVKNVLGSLRLGFGIHYKEERRDREMVSVPDRLLDTYAKAIIIKTAENVRTLSVDVPTNSEYLDQFNEEADHALGLYSKKKTS